MKNKVVNVDRDNLVEVLSEELPVLRAKSGGYKQANLQLYRNKEKENVMEHYLNGNFVLFK